MANKSKIKIMYEKSILSVSNSILRHFNISREYSSLEMLDNLLDENYQNIVLMILDGMGSEIIAKNLPEDSFLRRHVIDQISSVFPSTTTAATTAYHSGLPPIASGWLGWMCYFPEYDKIIELFRNTEYYSGKTIEEPPVSESFIKYKPIYKKIVEQNPDVEYHRIFPSFEENGCCSFKEECQRLIDCVSHSQKKKILSVYWTEPDHTIHETGTESSEVKSILEDINKNLEILNKRIKNTIVIVSADHGLLDTQQVYLNEYPDLCETFLRPPTLESRFVNFFIKQDKKEIFETLFRKYFGEDFVLYTTQEFLETSILGEGKQHPLVKDFLGDFQTIAYGTRSLHYQTGEKEMKVFKAEHAGYTPAEMNVPLIVFKKR